MSASPVASPRRRYRRLGLLLALATLVVAIVVTQWPFEYRLTRYALQLRWHRIDWSWFPRTPRGAIRFDRDFALNLIMLTPLGTGFALWRRASGLRLLVESAVLGAATSALLEAAQLATRERYTSFADVWRNTFSCMLGCALVLVAMAYATRRAGAVTASR